MAFRAVIGIDISLTEDIDTGRAVMIESDNGTVCITGQFESWMGFKVLCEMEPDQAAEADDIAKRIASDPARELKNIGYDCNNWFQESKA